MVSARAGMRSARRGTRWIGPVLGVTAALLAGCQLSSAFTRDDPAAIDFSDAALASHGLAASPVYAYLDMMRELIEGDPLTQNRVFRDVVRDAASSPTTANRVKHALAVATPGHPNEDLAEAQMRLSDLLAAGPALLPEERMLVSIHLKEVEQRLILGAETARFRREAQLAREAREDEFARRLQAAFDENERLAKELIEAQQKLDAITNIERSIRERENGSNP